MASLLKALVFSLLPPHSLIQKMKGNRVYLTFDDGPHPENTPRILDALDAHRAKATFFVQGEHVSRYPALAKRIVAEGHTIAGHSWSHRRLTLLAFRDTWDEFKKTQTAISEATGVYTTLYRPPFGWVTLPMLLYAVIGRMRLVMWSVDSDDDRSRSVPTVMDKARQVQGGDIFLCHDDNSAILDALPELLREWYARGLVPCALGDDENG